MYSNINIIVATVLGIFKSLNAFRPTGGAS